MRRPLALVLSTALALAGLAAVPVAAQADDSKTLTVVGTSDVSDSNLVQSVIKPGFEKAFPHYTLNYVSKGTGAAIAYAEAGTASALLVHAASLENQYVQQGYATEQYGRAIFYGDYVLLGPKADPAGIETNTPHDVVGAFERVAAAGAAGTANFVSRGGTPGTTVQEHAIWALSQGVSTCTVSATNGGGTSPSTQTGACPSSIPYPSWYHATGLTQGPNVTNADTCNYSGGGCYVFTDRGTYDYLQSTGAITDLHVVTRDNDASARGGSTELVNSFHAYGVNPAKFSGDTAAGINTAGAQALLEWITSPAAQQAVGSYLSSGGDAPFLPDAAPAFTSSAVPAKLLAGRSVTLTGTLKNVAPGTPALSGQTVTLFAQAPRAALSPVASTTTDSTGAWRITYVPTSTALYRVSTGELAQVERPDLSPVFGDLLDPSTLGLGQVALLSNPSAPTLVQHGTAVTVTTRLTPRPTGSSIVKFYASPAGQPLRYLTSRTVPAGTGAVAAGLSLTKGERWQVAVVYASSTGQFTAGQSPSSSIVVR